MPENWVQHPVINTEEGSNPGAPLSWGSPENPDDVVAGYGYVAADTSEVEETFYYHSDHLGSTSYITDQNANVTQYDAYLPYGELLVDEHSSSADLPYKFNGKELDEETGLYYYGARYMNPVTSMWYGVDQLAEKYVLSGSYVYCLGNPIKMLDPDGKKGVLVHGTWSNSKTWKHQNEIKMASKNLFNDGELFREKFDWSGGNSRIDRREAAAQLIGYLQKQMLFLELKPGEPITLIAHSHGGNVCIEAINEIVEKDLFPGIKINLLTINTPVRSDYQLSEKAQKRVNHVNVYNPKDPVQALGGFTRGVEVGLAGRTFKNAKNIEVDNPKGVFGFQWVQGYDSNTHSATSYPIIKINGSEDFHNSHNQVNTWINKTKKEK